jgi:1-acyl-sn-glycerol-3-phosphate acyltransferase
MIPDFLLRHTIVRRLCSTALLLLLSAVALVLLPVVTVLSALLSAVMSALHRTSFLSIRGSRLRAARFAAFAATYLAAEFAGLFNALRLRASDQDAHYALLTLLLSMLFRTARKAFRLEIVSPAQGTALPDGPLIVFSRHAGPGDSFLLAYALLAVGGRRPRLVAKEILRLDPLIDIVLGRTPNCFVGRSETARADAPGRIAELSASLGPRDALLAFPEGGNFTTKRRRRLIDRLRRRRDHRILATAASLNHVLPAKPTGVFAAVDAAPPTAHVLFVAHTGLDRIETVPEAWRAVPLQHPVRLAWWSVPVTDIPAADHTRETWLKDQWTRIDAWIDHEADADTETDADASGGPTPHTALESQ